MAESDGFVNRGGAGVMGRATSFLAPHLAGDVSGNSPMRSLPEVSSSAARDLSVARGVIFGCERPL